MFYKNALCFLDASWLSYNQYDFFTPFVFFLLVEIVLHICSLLSFYFYSF